MYEFIRRKTISTASWIKSGSNFIGSSTRLIVESIALSVYEGGRTAYGGAKFAGRGFVKGANMFRSGVKMVIDGVSYLVKSAAQVCDIAASHIYRFFKEVTVGCVNLACNIVKFAVGETLVIVNDPAKLCKESFTICCFLVDGLPTFFCMAIANGIRIACDTFSPLVPEDVEDAFRNSPIATNYDFERSFQREDPDLEDGTLEVDDPDECLSDDEDDEEFEFEISDEVFTDDVFANPIPIRKKEPSVVSRKKKEPIRQLKEGTSRLLKNLKKKSSKVAEIGRKVADDVEGIPKIYKNCVFSCVPPEMGKYLQNFIKITPYSLLEQSLELLSQKTKTLRILQIGAEELRPNERSRRIDHLKNEFRDELLPDLRDKFSKFWEVAKEKKKKKEKENGNCGGDDDDIIKQESRKKFLKYYSALKKEIREFNDFEKVNDLVNELNDLKLVFCVA